MGADLALAVDHENASLGHHGRGEQTLIGVGSPHRCPSATPGRATYSGVRWPSACDGEPPAIGPFGIGLRGRKLDDEIGEALVRALAPPRAASRTCARRAAAAARLRPNQLPAPQPASIMAAQDREKARRPDHDTGAPRGFRAAPRPAASAPAVASASLASAVSSLARLLVLAGTDRHQRQHLACRVRAMAAGFGQRRQPRAQARLGRRSRAATEQLSSAARSRSRASAAGSAASRSSAATAPARSFRPFQSRRLAEAGRGRRSPGRPRWRSREGCARHRPNARLQAAPLPRRSATPRLRPASVARLPSPRSAATPTTSRTAAAMSSRP